MEKDVTHFHPSCMKPVTQSGRELRSVLTMSPYPTLGWQFNMYSLISHCLRSCLSLCGNQIILCFPFKCLTIVIVPMYRMFNQLLPLPPFHVINTKKTPKQTGEGLLKSPHIKATFSHLAHMHIFLNGWQNSSPAMSNFNRKHPSGESGSCKLRNHRVGASDLNSKFELFNLDLFL